MKKLENWHGKRFLQGLLIGGLLFTQILHAEGIERLLNEYKEKNDLSQKTIDENKGHLVLFTRDRLERMHARTLKDVLKMTPVIYYHENRYGLPDPLVSGAFEPYRSNFIRLFIDGVEITQGWLGSGVVLYGDMDINFADHIEFYYMTPSLETSVEPAYMTIFIYSKEPEQDAGTSLDLLAGSRGYNVQNVNFGGKERGVSYMVNVSRTQEKRERIDNGTDHPLKRDFDRLQLMGYAKTKTQAFHIQLMQKNTDALAGLSLDATPEVSEIDYQNVHIDYRYRFTSHWQAQFSYDLLKTNTRISDDNPLLYVGALLGEDYYAKSKNSTYSGELTYMQQWRDHRIATGIKGRFKKLDYLKEERFGKVSVIFNREDIWSVFVQDQYHLAEDKLLNIGIEYSRIHRNSLLAKDDNLLQARIGYIYSGENWSYKAYLYRSMFSLDPFSTALRNANLSKKKDLHSVQKTWGVTQEVGVTGDHYGANVMIFLLKDEDGLLQNGGDGNTKYFTTVFRYNYRFDSRNRMDLQLYYANYKDIFELDHLEDYSGYLTFSNQYGKFDFYNSVVWHQNSIDNKNYFDLTSSVSWNIHENLTLTIKGENLLDKAKKTDLFRVDPVTGSLLPPLEISPIDRRVIIEMEYLF